MILLARSSSLRTRTNTCDAYLVKSMRNSFEIHPIAKDEVNSHVASSAALSPPPTTAKGLFLFQRIQFLIRQQQLC
jgi:hypothetical protein